MYVAPDTNLMFIKNCPLAANLEHTILFSSKAAQQQYFTERSIQVSKYTFQRATAGVVRVGLDWDTCIGFNYMAFQNHAHGDKWFYAFITNYEYLNEGCTIISFRIDVLQTYMFDWDLGSCYIERETTPTDEIGEYLLPEGLDTGTPKISTSTARYFDIVWLLASTADLTTSGFPDVKLNSVVYDNQAVSYNIYACTSISFVNNILSALVEAGKISAIQFLYPAPKPFVELVGEASSLGVWNVRITSNTVSLGLYPVPDTLDGYEPKNNKMFTAPYAMCRVVSSSGSAVGLRFEFSDNNRINLSAETSLLPQSAVRAFPLNYDGMAKNYLENSTLSGLPLGAFNYDIYARWFAEHQSTSTYEDIKNGVALGVGVIKTVAGVGTFLASGGVTMDMSSDLTFAGMQDAYTAGDKILSKLSAIEDMKLLPPSAANGASSSEANLAHNSYGFLIQIITIRKEWAKSIDEFFTRYGYRVMTTKIPTLQNRSKWDYIKTLDADIGGNVPGSALAEIRRTFNRGITFWHGAENFGDYSQNNEPVG